MDLQLATEQRIAAALMKIRYRIEFNTSMALVEMGMGHSRKSVAAAEQAMRELSPLYVKTIEVRGRTCRNMYDEHPGLAFFYVDDAVRYQAPSYCGLQRAKTLAAGLLREADEASIDEDQYDGLFKPSSVVLLDQFGSPVQEGSLCFVGPGVDVEECVWVAAHPGEAEWASLEQAAEALSSESCVEAGWDNFDTARGLRAHGDQLLNSVAIAKARLRVIA